MSAVVIPFRRTARPSPIPPDVIRAIDIGSALAELDEQIHRSGEKLDRTFGTKEWAEELDHFVELIRERERLAALDGRLRLVT
jgi:hypothetical protein